MRKLLLADDSVTIQRVIELTFSGEDIQVVAVNDGEQAIARIPTELPDIVLADIGMPKKGGYDVAAFVKGRADLEHIPVLLLAGAFEPVDQARAEQVRCDGVLIKPFEPRQVIERVRELLEGMKGSPAQATADVLRPLERISPQPVPVVPPVAAVAVQAAVAAWAPAAAPPMPAAPPPAVETEPPFQSDPTLDEYFESLNSAFESVGHAAPAAAVASDRPVFEAAPAPPAAGPDRASRANAPAGAGRRRGDSLDDYFDRLSTAFEHVKPTGTPHQLPDGFDELLEEPRVPGVDAHVGTQKPADGNGHSNGNGAQAAPHRVNGHGSASPRNPIVEALEALLRSSDDAVGVPSQPTLPGLADVGIGTSGAPVRGELADAITERVLGRLVPEITATVQRLVHEEVGRIRKHH